MFVILLLCLYLCVCSRSWNPSKLWSLFAWLLLLHLLAGRLLHRQGCHLPCLFTIHTVMVVVYFQLLYWRCCYVLSFVDWRIVDVVTSLSLCIAKSGNFHSSSVDCSIVKLLWQRIHRRRPQMKQPWYLPAPLHWHGHCSRHVVIVTDCWSKLVYYPLGHVEEGMPGRSTTASDLINWHRQWWWLSVVDQLKS